MKKEKKLYVIIIVLLIALVISLIFNITKTAKLKNGEEVAIKYTGGKITADDIYTELKEKYAMNILVNKIDHALFDEKYKSDENEKSQINAQIENLKSTYTDENTYKQVLQSYYGVETEEQLRELLSLQYKRGLAVNEYISKNVITDAEVKEYYNSKVIGDVKASHILIKSNANEDDSEDEKLAKEKEALEKAKEVIAKLKKGEDFAKLAKKYSDDKGTASEGGSLGYFNTDDNYDETFVMATASLEKGKYTEEPVKTQYGYEIILKEDEKDKPKLEDKESEIRKTLAEEKLSSNNNLYYTALEKVREENKLSFKDSSLEKQYKNYLKKLQESINSSSK